MQLWHKRDGTDKTRYTEGKVMRRGTVLNLISGLFLHVINILSGFIIPRLILIGFGSSINGVTNSISQLLTYVALVEMGISNSAVIKLYEPFLGNDYQAVNTIVSEVKRKYNIAGVLYLGIVLLLSFTYPFAIKDQLPYDICVILFLIIGINGALDYLFIGKYKILLIANQKYYVYNVVRSISVLFVLISSVILYKHSASITTLKSMLIVFHIVEAILISAYCKHFYPQIDYKDNKRVRFDQQRSALIVQLATVVTYNTDLITLTFFAGENSLVEVSVYSVYMLTYSVIVNSLLVIYNSFYPAFGKQIAQHNSEELLRKFDMYEYIYQIVLAVVYSVYAVSFHPFVRIYTSGVNDGNYNRFYTIILFWFAAYTAQIKDSSYIFINAAGKYKETCRFHVWEAVINISISIILVGRYGMFGVLIGTIISHIYFDIMISKYVSEDIVGNNLPRTYGRILRNLLLLVVLFVSEYPIIRFMDSIARFIGISALIFAINGVLIGLFNALLEKDMARNIRILFVSIMRRIRGGC